jgi:hypothetical protein
MLPSENGSKSGIQSDLSKAGVQIPGQESMKMSRKMTPKTPSKMTFGTATKSVQFVVRFRSIFGQCSGDEVLAEFGTMNGPSGAPCDQPLAHLEASPASVASQPRAWIWTVSATEVRGTKCNIKARFVTAAHDCFLFVFQGFFWGRAAAARL